MRIIGHLDMDAFFAAVEERNKPRLRGLPIVVGADPENGRGRGVVSTANYKARAYGIRSAMPIGKAWDLSEKARRSGKPPVVFMGGSFEQYNAVSKQIMAILVRYSPVVRQVSVDEAYFDLTHTNTYESATALAKKIKAAIKKETGLTSTIGIGSNKLIAKIASDRKKPDGLTVVRLGEIQNFLDPLAVRVIPGVGPRAEATLSKLGIRVIRDLRAVDEIVLKTLFGAWGASLHRLARGESSSTLATDQKIKSIGERETFRNDSRDPNFLIERLKKISARVGERFKKSGFRAYKRIVVMIRFSDFETVTRSRAFEKPAISAKDLCVDALKIFLPFFDDRENPRRKKIRLIGVRIEKFS